jgi:hypothetical protein
MSEIRKRPIVTAFNVSANISKLMSLLSSVTTSFPGGPTLKPTANLNPRPSGPGPYQAGVVYQSNGNAVTSNYGGGVKIELPF